MLEKWTPSGPTTWKDTRRHALNRTAKSANRNVEQLCEVFTPCIDDQQFTKEELETLGEIVKRLLSNHA